MNNSKILIRFDDICPTMCWKQVKIAESLMDNYNIKPLIGVIPDCKDSDLKLDSERFDFWQYINNLQNKGYTIAMHGVNHTFCSNFKGVVNNRIGSEFSGLSLEEQIAKIKKGKEILESHGIYTDIFLTIKIF